MKEENKNQKKFLILSIILSLLLVLSLVNIWLYVASTKKVVYVDTTLLYENFQGKKELEAQFSAFVGKQEKILDSLKLDIDKKYDEYQLNKSKEVETAIILKEKNYERLNQEFTKVSQEQRSKFMDELWKQINEYVQQFGKENHYKVILGANGTGSLMYSDKALDITPELTSYINSRYAGE